MVEKLKGFVTVDRAKYYETDGETVGFGGDSYNLLNFDAKHINVEKMAHSLSQQVRYIGNIYGFYSIAQHSWYIAHNFLVRGEIDKALQGLFHDGSEHFVSDVQAPLKRLIQRDSKIFQQIEPDIEAKIAAHFGFKYPYDEDVMAVDKNMAIWELENMIKNNNFNDYWLPEKAKAMFINMYKMIREHQQYYALSA